MASPFENPLYDLKDTAAGPAVVTHLYETRRREESSAQIDMWITGFVIDAFVPERTVAGLRDLYRDEWARRPDDEITSALGFALLAQEVDRRAHAPADTDASAAAGPLQNDAVADYFRAWYGLGTHPLLDFSEAEINHYGTTSFIIKCTEGKATEERALKCLLPRYTTSPIIREETEEYVHFMKRAEGHTATVLDSAPKWILMEWAAEEPVGETLLFGEQRAPSAPLPSRKLIETSKQYDELHLFAMALVGVLKKLSEQENPVFHLDLSPTNILVPADKPTSGIKLIDFGVNFLVEEGVGSAQSISGANLYMSPEVASGTFGAKGATADMKRWADLYSVGTLMLQILSEGTLTRENFDTQLRELWASAPGWARIVEDLTHTKPSSRLALKPSGMPHYDHLEQLLEREQDQIKTFGVDDDDSEAVGSPTRFRALAVRSFDVPRRLHKASVRQDGSRNPTYGGLASWSAFTMGLWVVSATSFVMLVSADLGSSNAFTETLNALFDLPYEIGPQEGAHWENLGDNIWGRLVAITFAACAAAYYMNIFATLSLKEVAGGLERTAEIVMRLCAVWPWFPILAALLVIPEWWPLWSALGCFVVVLNNLLMWQVAIKAQRKDPDAIRQDFLDDYKNWWSQMALLTAALFGLFVLFLVQPNLNHWFWALLMAGGVNYMKMYRLNSYQRAPWARGNLQHSIFILRREQALHQKGVAYADLLLGQESAAPVQVVVRGEIVQLPDRAVRKLREAAVADVRRAKRPAKRRPLRLPRLKWTGPTPWSRAKGAMMTLTIALLLGGACGLLAFSAHRDVWFGSAATALFTVLAYHTITQPKVLSWWPRRRASPSAADKQQSEER